MRELKINPLAILVIVVLGQLIPMGWYGIFAEPWMKYSGVTQEMAESGGAAPYITSIVSTLAMALMMAMLFRRLRVESLMDGLLLGAGIGFAFHLLPNMTSNLFSFRPYELSWIDGGYYVVVTALAGAILGAWRKYV
jgi:Protein of unknown function (DUF1761)